MTVGVAVRVPGVGCVLAADGRVCLENGEITTDSDDKTMVASSYAALCAGALGGLWVDLLEAVPRNRAEFRKAVTDIEAQDHDRSYEFLLYDRRADALFGIDHQGDQLKRGIYAAIGCGAPYALGVLDVSTMPRSLDGAVRLVRRAIKVAARRHSAVGGRVRVLVVPRGRGAVQVR